MRSPSKVMARSRLDAVETELQDSEDGIIKINAASSRLASESPSRSRPPLPVDIEFVTDTVTEFLRRCQREGELIDSASVAAKSIQRALRSYDFGPDTVQAALCNLKKVRELGFVAVVPILEATAALLSENNSVAASVAPDVSPVRQAEPTESCKSIPVVSGADLSAWSCSRTSVGGSENLLHAATDVASRLSELRRDYHTKYGMDGATLPAVQAPPFLRLGGSGGGGGGGLPSGSVSAGLTKPVLNLPPYLPTTITISPTSVGERRSSSVNLPIDFDTSKWTNGSRGAASHAAEASVPMGTSVDFGIRMGSHYMKPDMFADCDATSQCNQSPEQDSVELRWARKEARQARLAQSAAAAGANAAMRDSRRVNPQRASSTKSVRQILVQTIGRDGMPGRQGRNRRGTAQEIFIENQHRLDNPSPRSCAITPPIDHRRAFEPTPHISDSDVTETVIVGDFEVESTGKRSVNLDALSTVPSSTASAQGRQITDMLRRWPLGEKEKEGPLDLKEFIAGWSTSQTQINNVQQGLYTALEPMRTRQKKTNEYYAKNPRQDTELTLEINDILSYFPEWRK